MAKIMKRTAIISVAATIILSFLYGKTNWDFIYSAAITFGTVAFHIIMRLLVGSIVDCMMHNHADYDKKWYQLRPFDEIAQATCQSEIVHEINMVVSFLPLFAAYLFGSFMVFLITSTLAACFDLLFVIMQRYNRPRLVKLAKKMK